MYILYTVNDAMDKVYTFKVRKPLADAYMYLLD